MTGTDFGKPYTPPRQPVALSYSTSNRPSTWPTVIGIIAIAFGSLEVLGSVCGVFAPLLVGALVKVMPPGQATSMEWAKTMPGWQIASQVVNLAIAILLLFAGIDLLRRRSRGRVLCMTWAPFKMLAVVLGLVLGYFVQKVQFAAMQQDPNLGAAMSGSLTSVVMVFGLAFGLLWGWALPIFVLIWFSRRKIKAQVAGWQNPADACLAGGDAEVH